MLTVTEDDSSKEEAVPPQKSQPLIDESAKTCKRVSYDLYTDLTDAVNSAVAQNSESCTIDIGRLKMWKSQAKQCNQSVTRHVKSVMNDKYRSEAEFHMLKFAMKDDVLDRESAYTEALEIISDRSCVSDLPDTVSRALRFSILANNGISKLGEREPNSCNSIAKCLALCEDDDEASL